MSKAGVVMAGGTRYGERVQRVHERGDERAAVRQQRGRALGRRRRLRAQLGRGAAHLLRVALQDCILREQTLHITYWFLSAFS